MGCGCGIWDIIMAKLLPVENVPVEKEWELCNPEARALVKSNIQKKNLNSGRCKVFTGDMFRRCWEKNLTTCGCVSEIDRIFWIEV